MLHDKEKWFRQENCPLYESSPGNTMYKSELGYTTGDLPNPILIIPLTSSFQTGATLVPLNTGLLTFV